jgi:hypothetical protein
MVVLRTPPLLLLICIALSALIVPAPAEAQEGRGSVVGSVTMEGSGKPGADIEIRLAFGSKSISVRTGSNGTYRFEQLLAGQYTVRIVPPQAMRVVGRDSTAVTIDNGPDTERADFIMAPKATPTMRSTPAPSATSTATPTITPTPKRSPIPGSTPVINSPFTSSSSSQARQPAASPAVLDFGLSGLTIAGSPTAQETPTTATPTPTAGATPEATAAPTGPPRRLITSFAQLRDAAGAAGASQLTTLTTDASFLLRVPFRTQIDGTAFSLVNCGPASLSMVLAAFGLDVDPPSLRDYLNRLVGNDDTEQGTSLYALAQIAQEAGLNVFGPSGRGGYQSWTVDAIRDQIRAGHPVITLTKYRRLPGHFGSVTDFDHYIVITGLAGVDFVYNDGAFSTEYGYNLIITPDQLERAWADSSVPRHAIAVGFGDSLRPLPTVPDRLIAESLRAPADRLEMGTSAAVERATSALRPVRGPATEWLREQALESLGARSAVADGDGTGGRTETSRAPVEPSDEAQTTLSVQLSDPRQINEGMSKADAERPATTSAVLERGVNDGEQPGWQLRYAFELGLLLALSSLVLVVWGSYVGYRRHVRSPQVTGSDPR